MRLIMKKLILSSILILVFGWYVLSKNTVPFLSQNSASTSYSTKNTTQQIPTSHYKDGQYVGTATDAYYGNVQVAAVIIGGKITEVKFLEYPQERQNSVRLNENAIPRLQTETIAVQSATVDSITGASLTSAAYLESLTSALSQATS